MITGDPEGELQLAKGLVGSRLPSFLLTASEGEAIDLQSFATRSVAIYVYPGAKMSPDGQEHSLSADAVQRRAFDARERDLSALSLAVVGISSESPELQRERRQIGGVRHTLLSDPDLLLAGSLGLPTFEDRGLRWYRRLTIIVHHGRIGKVFFPVISPVCNSAQVIAWARINFGGMRGAVDVS